MEQQKAAAEQIHQGLPPEKRTTQQLKEPDCCPTANPDPEAIQQPSVSILI